MTIDELFSGIPSRVGHIYLAKAKDTYKIGFSAQLDKRMCVLNSDNGELVKVISSACVEKPREIEKRLHEKFKSDRLKGEWFIFDEEQIKYIKEYFNVVKCY